jgi:hypothetical protein
LILTSSFGAIRHFRASVHPGASEPGRLQQHDRHRDRLPVQGIPAAADQLGQDGRLAGQRRSRIETGKTELDQYPNSLSS